MGDVAALERALLPAIPERLGGVRVSVAYRSSEGPAAGGDFYDAFELPGSRAAVIVGDISGHGPDALEGTNSVRAQLHALLETGMTPRAAIALVGERSPVQLAGRFSTVVVAIHDPVDGTLTIATAGHAPPVVAGDGVDELLSAGASPPIGVGLRTGLRQTTVSLPPGSTCCFYTDGIVEAKNGEGMIGRGRLKELVAALEPGEQADVLLERVLDEAHDASDDMTICLLRPVAGPAEQSPRIEVLEFDADEVESGFVARFLDACGVPPIESEPAVERARELVRSAGFGLLEVTMSGGGLPGARGARHGAGGPTRRRLAERERVGLGARGQRQRQPVLAGTRSRTSSYSRLPRTVTVPLRRPSTSTRTACGPPRPPSTRKTRLAEKFRWMRAPVAAAVACEALMRQRPW